MTDAPLLAPYQGRGSRPWAAWLLPPVAARRLCRPSRPDRIDDRATRAVQRARAAAGFVVILGVALAYQVADAVEAVTEPWVQLIQNCVVLVLVVPVGLVLFVRAARPDLRRGYLRRARGPLCALLAVAGSLGFILVVSATRSGNSFRGSAFWLLFLLTWMIFFGLGALVNGVANVFRTADVHEVLPPLVSVALVWGGPLTVTCLALWELRRLRRGHGLTLRRALGR